MNEEKVNRSRHAAFGFRRMRDAGMEAYQNSAGRGQ